MLAPAQRRNPANSAPVIATRQRRALRGIESSAAVSTNPGLPHQILLTVKLRGRATTPDERRGRTLSSGARGAKPQAHHGPLQRLLGGVILLMRLRRSAGQFTRSQILELTVREAPQRVRCSPNVMCAAQKFRRNSDFGGR
jgi:hypothetical protein